MWTDLAFTCHLLSSFAAISFTTWWYTFGWHGQGWLKISNIYSVTMLFEPHSNHKHLIMQCYPALING